MPVELRTFVVINGGSGHTAQIFNRWIYINQADRMVNHFPGVLSISRVANNKRHARTLFPGRIFKQIIFFTDIVTVITKQNNNRIIGKFTLFNGADHTADNIVSKSHTSKIALKVTAYPLLNRCIRLFKSGKMGASLST